MRVAVTGAGGRLGTSLIAALADSPFVAGTLAWDLPEHDLDDPRSADRLVSRHKPDVVIHAAAWTDVDGCALDPALALRRNGAAVGEMAEACVRAGAGLVMVSTNEVFDGLRTDGSPYRPTDPPNPQNSYARAKAAGELAARAAYGVFGREFESAVLEPGDRNPQVGAALAIVRTAWLFGVPGADFPQKILAAAKRAKAAGQPLGLVADEIGTPTYAPDLAAAIVALLAEHDREGGRGFGGVHHVINSGRASRAEWARETLRLAGLDVATEDVPMSTWSRPSTPPPWGVMKPTPLPGGPLREWRAALAEYMERISPRDPAGG
jgi:dTDP-4-dehydrorhamnose reductase